MFQNEEIIKGTITTNSISSGLLNPEQAKQFIKQTFDATPLASAVRHEMRRARTGYIDKIGIAKRIVRKKVENTDDGYRATVTPSQVEYKTTAIRLPWEITGETLRENIEGQSFEATVTNLMTSKTSISTATRQHLHSMTQVRRTEKQIRLWRLLPITTSYLSMTAGSSRLRLTDISLTFQAKTAVQCHLICSMMR